MNVKRCLGLRVFEWVICTDFGWRGSMHANASGWRYCSPRSPTQRRRITSYWRFSDGRLSRRDQQTCARWFSATPRLRVNQDGSMETADSRGAAEYAEKPPKTFCSLFCAAVSLVRRVNMPFPSEKRFRRRHLQSSPTQTREDPFFLFSVTDLRTLFVASRAAVPKKRSSGLVATACIAARGAIRQIRSIRPIRVTKCWGRPDDRGADETRSSRPNWPDPWLRAAKDRCPSRQFQQPWRESDPSVVDR